MTDQDALKALIVYSAQCDTQGLEYPANGDKNIEKLRQECTIHVLVQNLALVALKPRVTRRNEPHI